MAGTLTISTISDGTNSTSATNAIQGSAKAWVNWNGSTAAIRKSYNVSSITKITTGEYIVTFTNALADANYSSVGSCSADAAPTQSAMVMDFSGSTNSTVAPTTTTIRVFTSNLGAGRDVIYASLAIFD
jgi:hypothetical protein